MHKSNKQEFHIAIEADGKTAVEWLAESSGLSKQKIKQCMQKGCVWLEHNGGTHKNKTYIQRLRRAKKIVVSNEILHFYYDEEVLNSETKEASLIEDYGDYSIWNKPSGMLSQGSKWGDHCTINRWAERYLQPERPAFIVHRLDRAANGLIILAHKKQVANQFSRMFEKREIEKRYQVTVEGDFSKKVITDNSLTINEAVDGKAAISHVFMKNYSQQKNSSLLKVEIETGRKHQIRKHLASIGFPVVGDRLYGTKAYPDEINLQLQAKSLKFICPITSEQRAIMLDS